MCSKITSIGTLTWAIGGKYVGDFVDDERHGKGIDTLPDGTTYKTEYDHGTLTKKTLASKNSTREESTCKKSFIGWEDSIPSFQRGLKKGMQISGGIIVKIDGDLIWVQKNGGTNAINRKYAFPAPDISCSLDEEYMLLLGKKLMH